MNCCIISRICDVQWPLSSCNLKALGSLELHEQPALLKESTIHCRVKIIRVITKIPQLQPGQNFTEDFNEPVDIWGATTIIYHLSVIVFDI